jgi:acyl-CoA reductase-like NAD-dependent aldehyde dehydrogenase
MEFWLRGKKLESLDAKLVGEIVQAVMARLQHEGLPGKSMGPVYDSVHEAVAAARDAQEKWLHTPKEIKAKVIRALRETMHQYAQDFSQRAWQETGMGRVQDKIVKHHNAADATPGLEDLEPKAWTGDKGLVVEEWAPYGLVAAITPSTHPIPVLFNSLVIISAPGNAVIFNVHPAAKKVSAYALEIFNKVIIENGGPANLATMLREPTMEGANELFRHPDISLIAATGGPGLVRAASASGKKVIAAGPGNPPVLIDETACLTLAARSIIDGAAFDNNILCIAEKEVIIVASKIDAFMNALEKAGAVRLNPGQIAQLTDQAFIKNQQGRFTTNREFIGKNANVLGRAIGLDLSDEVRLLFGETPFEHLFVQEEQMMPFMPVVRVADVQEGIARAVKAEHGFGHTATIYSNNLDTITKYMQAMDTSIVVVNGPSLAGNGGIGGEAYFSHTIASPTGEGVCTPRNFARYRRAAFYRKLNQIG